MVEDKILLTARYVEGDMSETEKMGFEMRVQYEIDLQEHLKHYNEIHRNLQTHLGQHKAEDLLCDTLFAYNKQYFIEKEKQVTTNPLIHWLTGIAAILLTAYIIWAPWDSNLYHQYSEHRPMSLSQIGISKSRDLEKAVLLYNQQNFDAAQALLKKQHEAHPTNAMLSYYYGNALIETNHLDQARSILNTIYKSNTTLKYDAAYAIALSYLKNDRKYDAKIWLNKIPSQASQYNLVVQLMGKL